MVKVFLSLGSNVEREKHIPEALSDLESLFGTLTVSSLYESEPVGFEGDPFYNLVVMFETERPLDEIAGKLREVEIAHGRTGQSRKFESRRLDIDLILYGDRVTEEGRLPREEITQYAFMLEPLAEIAPQQQHPVLGKSFACLWAAFDKDQLKQKRV
ncbi:MAG: 2-amino-4-hydroxy-6-hydroxymethyldihydropteridine diphosphokinase [Methylococcaceae bacterium]|nr:2-amino-4-hydroxy-6-hydroxymethyldihydropteridine diphosphokinase [Methylococcaceae bacterium]